MNYTYFLIMAAIMAGVTYLIRVLPLVLFQKKIENERVNWFLFYVPYAVLTAMTIPAIFTSTSYVASAVLGLAVALLLGYKEKGIMTIAMSASAAVYVAERVLDMIFA